MSIKSKLRNTAMTAVIAMASLSIAAPASAASPVNRGYANCSIVIINDGSMMTLMATAAPGLSGSYRLTAYSSTPGNSVSVDQSGEFTGTPGRTTVLTQSFLSLSYVLEAGSTINANPYAPRRMMDELRDAQPGIDASLNVELEVYDRSGRTICRQTDATYAQMPSRARSSMSSYGRPRGF